MLRTSNLTKPLPGRPAIPPQAGPADSYLDLYGLSKPPFTDGDSDLGYVLFSAHRPTFERLVDHLINGSGLAVLNGGEGSGKSRMLAAACDVAAEAGIRIIRPNRQQHGRISRADLLTAIFGPAATAPDGATDTQNVVNALLGPPRAVLVLDDAELLSADCHPVLITLLQDERPGVAVVLAINPFLQSSVLQPIVTRHARTQLHVARLSAAEIREYIERLLWTAGGTTRRLITDDALRTIVTASEGSPGSVNRLMEAIFIAGFARGDAMITGRTVASVVGPSKTKPRREALRAPGWFPQVMGGSLLVIGLAAFLYRGLIAPAYHPQPAVSAAGPAASGPAQDLVLDGSTFLRLGDIPAARLSFQRAADAGDAGAAAELAKTYDPVYQKTGGDPAKAAAWYKKAMSMGDPQAGVLLAQMQAATATPTAP